MLNQLELQNKPKNKRKKVSKSKKQAKRTVAKESFEFHLNKRLLFIISILLILAGLVSLLPKEDLLPIDKITLHGSFNQLDTKEIELQLEPFLGQGFFSVDIQGIQQKISEQPWIKNVSVRRIWPNRLTVSVKENQAYARWDDHHLISTEAVIFKAESNKFSHLPLINGYSGQSVELLNQYVELQQKFLPFDISLTEFHEDSKGAISLLLNNQLLVNLGSENNRQKIQHLLAVYPEQIKTRTEHIQYIDFRYSNGFAIAWKKEYLKKIGKLDKRSNTNV